MFDHESGICIIHYRGNIMSVCITGAAGFIGYHACYTLLKKGEIIYGFDNLNDYYDPKLKQERLRKLAVFPNFHFKEIDIADYETVKSTILELSPGRILHLAAQAGVRYSLENPMAYVHSNLVGHVSMLEAARALTQKRPGCLSHFVYASSSSVYGECKQDPFREDFIVDHPVSLYAATKKSDELISHSYSHLYGIAQTGLRFFTVYGPWGRPDMAYWLFTEAILQNRPIPVFNQGKMKRDFTYIEDILPALIACLYDTPPLHAHRIYNIGGSNPVPLEEMIELLEEITEKPVEKIYKPMQSGDVTNTSADITQIMKDYGYQPKTSLKTGLQNFVSWYRQWVS